MTAARRAGAAAGRALRADFAAALAGIARLAGLSVCLHDLADFSPREFVEALLS